MGDGAKLIHNVRYFHIAKPGERAAKNVLTKEAAAGLLQYIATRESVQLNFNENYERVSATASQIEKIKEFTTEFPGLKQNELYKKYTAFRSAANATRFIIQAANYYMGIDAAGEYRADAPATPNQIHRIEQFLESIPEMKNTPEYEDFQKFPTFENASELISHTAEEALAAGVADPETAEMLLRYIATRPGVLKNGEHGLFSSETNIDLQEAMNRFKETKGNIWTHVISLRREDAERLGYDNQKAWKDTVFTQIDNIAKGMNIPLRDLKWYAAMHNTKHHPHIHLFTFSDNPKQGFLKQDGIRRIKSGFAHEIFKAEFEQIYQQKTELVSQLKEQSTDLLFQLNHVSLDQEIIAELSKLKDQLLDIPGRHLYKFLPQETKQLIHSVLDQIGEIPQINALHSLYQEQRNNMERIYQSDGVPKKLSDYKSGDDLFFFKNLVIRAAEGTENFATSTLNFQPESSPPAPLSSEPEVAIPTFSKQPTEFTDHEAFIIPPSEARAAVQEPDESPVKFSPGRGRSGRQLTPSEETDKVYALTVKATEGDHRAQFQLANLYFYNWNKFDIWKNIPKEELLGQAQMFYGLASAGGHGEASYTLAKIYLYGTVDGETNLELADYYFHKAEDQLEYNLELSEKKKDTYVRPAKAEYLLGQIYYKGAPTIPQNFEKAFCYFSDAAEHKHTHANYYLGRMFERGEYVSQDYTVAISCYSKAVQKNDGYAAYALGRLYQYGKGTEANIERAAGLYAIAAEQDNPFAQYALAQIHGDGTAQRNADPEAAYLLYEKALNYWEKEVQLVSNQEISYRVGRMYEKGLGTSIDMEKAFERYKTSADGGHLYAQLKVARLFEATDYQVSAYYYALSLPQLMEEYEQTEDPRTAYQIAKMYEEGKGTVPDPNNRGFMYYTLSADGGNLYAQLKLAKYFEKVNAESSTHYYALALPQLLKEYDQSHDSWTAYQLGRMYENGLGTDANKEKAFNYYRESADGGNLYAQLKIAKHLELSEPEAAQRYYDLALPQLHKEYEESHDPWTAYQLGKIYENGLGADANKEKAFNYYRESADSGNLYAQLKMAKHLKLSEPEAAQRYYALALPQLLKEYDQSHDSWTAYQLGHMYENGLGTDTNEEKAFNYYRESADGGNLYAQLKTARHLESTDQKASAYYYSLAIPQLLKEFEQSGEPWAAYQLGYMYQKGLGTTANETLSHNFYAKALEGYLNAENHSPSADTEYRLGCMYLYGQGVEADTSQAVDWLKTARTNGSKDAEALLDSIHRRQLQQVGQTLLMSIASALKSQAEQQQQNRMLTARGVDRKAKAQTRKLREEMGIKEEQGLSM